MFVPDQGFLEKADKQERQGVVAILTVQNYIIHYVPTVWPTSIQKSRKELMLEWEC